MPVWEDEDEGESFFNCPVRFITEAVIEWYSEHSYFEMYPGTAPEYNRMPAKFVEAVTHYKHCFNKYLKRKRKSGDKSTEGLNLIRQAYDGR